MSAAIEVVAIRKYDGTGSLKAFVDIRLGGITLKGCKIVQQDDKAAWVAMPSTKTEHGWQNVVEVTKSLRERITDVVLAEWQQREQPIRPPLRDTATRERVAAPERPGPDDRDFYDDTDLAVADLEGRER